MIARVRSDPVSIQAPAPNDARGWRTDRFRFESTARDDRVRGPASRAARLIGIVVWAALFPSSSAVAADAPLIAGLLPLDAQRAEHWCTSGTWVAPVGDPCFGAAGEPEYRVNRGLERNEAGALTHRGVDLCNRQAGGTVRAAAHGIVVLAANAGGGYGTLVVLAHRFEDSSFVYTVYAHLVSGSIPLEAGQTVTAGQPIGRVGRSGNASTDHLHFEVRTPLDLASRWEKCRAVDPMTYLEARRSCRSDDTTWARPYLEWADRRAMIDPRWHGDDALTRHRWWRMLANAAPRGSAPRGEAAALRRRLVAEGLLSADEPDADGPMTWTEAIAELDRLRAHGIGAASFEAGLRPVADGARPGNTRAGRPDRVADRSATPSIADACRALAELADEAHLPALGTRAP